MITLSDLILLSVLLIPFLYWYSSQPIREASLKAAHEHCESLGLQLLDNAVFQRRLWFKRGRDGRLHLWRAYYFDFTSTGNDRYGGRVVTLGKTITDIELEPHRIQ